MEKNISLSGIAGDSEGVFSDTIIKINSAQHGISCESIETEDGFLFRLRDGKYTLLAYLGDEDTITLPQSIEGNDYAIYKFMDGKNVIIPDGVIAMGNPCKVYRKLTEDEMK